MDKKSALLMSTAALAYLGDSVLEVMVREKLVSDKKGDIHGRAKAYVTAVAQSDAAQRLMPVFTEDEADVYRRGRNNTHSAPRSATHAQYSRATGLECVFGYLYLAGEYERLRQLFDQCYNDG